MAMNDRYLLLTGATGLLGRSLLRDLSAAGRRLAVLVRAGRTDSAESRVDELLADWQEVAGAAVAAPVVLEGDITQPGLGLAPEATAWVEAHVDELIHSAASLSFQLRKSDGEPLRSNVEGTNNVLAFCRQTGIRRLHHVSSAYVCGLRQGRILETELDVGQTPGNDYERSKIISETAARGADYLDVCTVHRPSIIVGDLVHGFTNTFHGFYKPLRIVQPFVEAFLSVAIEAGSLLDVLGMTGEERKNLVPVDWVSAVMSRIILDRSLHGRTYHLTATKPTPVGRLCDVFASMVGELAEQGRREGESVRQANGFDPATLGRLFGDQMHVYQAYWRDDPVFDSAATQAVAPDLPAPELDDETLRRLCRFAIRNSFRWPPSDRVAVAVAARSLLEQRLGPASWKSATVPEADQFGLGTLGPGGGQWTVACGGGTPVRLHVGLPAAGVPVGWMTAATLERLIAGEADATQLLATGSLVIEGGDEEQREQVLARVAALSAAAGAAARRPLQPR